MPDDHALPFVSIIIPCLNSERTILLCLKSIFRMNYPEDRFEVILVDNGSTDGTLDLIRGFNACFFVRPGVTISALRNFGARHSRGDIFAFLDSDCVVPKSWLRNALKLVKDKSIGVAGCGYGLPDNPGWVIKAWYLPASVSPKEVSFVPAGSMVVPRDVFNSIQGFDERLITGEDYDLCQRVRAKGYRIIASSLAQVAHLDSTDTILKFLKKEIWYGRGMLPSFSPEKLLNRTIIFCHLFALFLILMVSALLLLCKGLFLTSSFIIFSLLLISASYRIFMKANCTRMKYFPQLIVLYFFYYLGRSFSLIQIYKEAFQSSFSKWCKLYKG